MTYLDGSAAAWLDRFMQAQARLMAESMFVTFGLGQLGASTHNTERSREIIDALRIDAGDIEQAGQQLATTLRDILANVEHNLEGATP